MIKDLVEGTKIVQEFQILQSAKGLSNSSEPYVTCILQDKTGQVEAKKWNSTPQDEEALKEGNFVRVTGDVILYRSKLQIKIAKAEELYPGDVTLEDLVLTAPIPKDELLAKITTYMGEINNPQIKKVVTEIFKESLQQFSIYPAASKNHHEYVSGLMHHTATMLEVAHAILGIYPNVDKNYLYAGILLHDVGKIDELSGPSLPRYTTKGKLLGHISIMQARIYETCKKNNIDDDIATVLQHLVLSHHGTKEFGSPVLPTTKEAELIHLIDDLDAKMNMFNKYLNEVEEGEFTQNIRALDNRSLYKARNTQK